MKYEITEETKKVNGITLRRIKALRDIERCDVKTGDLGGWVESENNLSQSGDAWVSGDASVFGNAEVYGNARVCGDARVCGNADFTVFKNSWTSGRYFTYTRSNKMWRVGCFYGTGKELIKKAFADSELSGRCYKAIVKAVEEIEKVKAELGQPEGGGAE